MVGGAEPFPSERGCPARSFPAAAALGAASVLPALKRGELKAAALKGEAAVVVTRGLVGSESRKERSGVQNELRFVKASAESPCR